MGNGFTFRILGALLAPFSLAGVAGAVPIAVQLNYDDFGHLPNSGPLCAPTATINSFMYLRNNHPALQNTELLTDYDGGGIGLSDLATDRNLLANGWTSPGGVSRAGTGGCGASAESFWEGKAYWVEDWAPGNIVLDGMVKTTVDPTTWHAGSVLENAFPTWDFLWQQLNDGEDVELTIFGLDNSFGHALTLTSLKFEDGNGNGVWNAGEQRKIDYLDPNNPSQLFESILTLQGDGSLKFNWHNGGSNTPANVYINAAYSESFVPEPGTLCLLGFAGIVLAVRQGRGCRWPLTGLERVDR